MKDSAVASITHGASLKVRGISSLSRGIKKGSLVAIMSLKGELIAIGRSVLSADDIVELDSGIAVEIERVVMPRDLYPPMWRRRSTDI